MTMPNVAAERTPTRILVADPHPLFVEGLRGRLPSEFEFVGWVRDAESLVREASRLRPDVVISEVHLPGGGGVETAQHILEKSPRSRVLFLSAVADQTLAADCLSAGASGYLVKTATAEEFVSALRAVSRGGRVPPPRGAGPGPEGLSAGGRDERTTSGLSPRAAEVVRRLAQGYSMKQVGSLLGITTRTVAFHKYRAMDLLGIESSAGLVRYAVDSGLVGRLTRPASPAADQLRAG
jgi:DNA-binding NarL/FixJ family response regulator